MRILQSKLGWLDVSSKGEDGPWDIYWTDTSVSVERVLKLKPHQVGCCTPSCPLECLALGAPTAFHPVQLKAHQVGCCTPPAAHLSCASCPHSS